MPRIRVKICGITRPEDARLAADAGADAIGMIFHPPAKRNISVDVARAIVGTLPPFVTPVGVFADAPAGRIIQTAQALGLHTVQLNGRETIDQVAELARANLSVLKAVRVDESIESQLAYWRQHVSAVPGIIQALVLETGHTAVAGGSGVPNDFGLIRRHQQAGLFAGLPPLIAAGGLTGDTVESVVRTLRPYAVDVSSGVESAVGVKDESKLRTFLDAARRA